MMIRILKIFVSILVILNLGALVTYLALPDFFSVNQQEADVSWTEGWLATEEMDGKRLSSVELHELRAKKSAVNVIEKDDKKFRQAGGLELSSGTDHSRESEPQGKGLLWNPRAIKSSDLFAGEEVSADESAGRVDLQASLDMQSKARDEEPQASPRKRLDTSSSPRGEALIPDLDIIADNFNSIPSVNLRTEMASVVFEDSVKIDAPPLKVTIATKPERSIDSIGNTSSNPTRTTADISTPSKTTSPDPNLGKDIQQPQNFQLETQSATEAAENIDREAIPKGFIKIANKIYDPFSKAMEPEVWVRCDGKGSLEVMIDKALLENLEGPPLTQDHLEMWIHKTGTNPPEGYGEISYQFGLGLGKEPWVLQFISSKGALEPKIRRHESQDFVVIEISGLEERGLLWNLVFSKAIMRDQGYWEQGLLFSAAEGFEWGKKDALFALDQPLTLKP